MGEGDEEYSYHDEQWAVYRTDESLSCISKTNVTLYVNCIGIKKQINF